MPAKPRYPWKCHEARPDDEPERLPPDWHDYGPVDLPIRPSLVEQQMEDLALAIVENTLPTLNGYGGLSLRTLGKDYGSKYHRVALHLHWKAGRVVLEICSREIPRTVVDQFDGSVSGYEDIEEKTVVTPTSALFEWVNDVKDKPADVLEPNEELYSPQLVGNKIDDPTNPLTAAQIAKAIWGKDDEAARKRAREWMKSRKLPATLADNPKDHYIVSTSALERLARIEGGALNS